MHHGGVRAASRAAGQPVSSTSSAIARLEKALGQKLLRRNDDGLALTLEGIRCRPAILRIATCLQEIHGCGPDQLPDQPVHLTALFRLAETVRAGSIRRGALCLQIGQPQLTRQIAQIEQSLGYQVAKREPTGLKTTTRGASLISRIANLETEWRNLTGSSNEPRAHSLRQYTIGSVIPATPDGKLATLLARLSGQLHLRYGVNFRLVSTLAEDLMFGLDSGRFDCVFIDARLPGHSYKQAEVMRGPVALVGYPHGDAEPEQLLNWLRHCPLVMQSRRSGLRQRADAFFEQSAGPSWRNAATIIEVDSLPIIVSMVKGAGFYSVLPEYIAKDVDNPSCLTLPEEHDQCMLLTWRKTARSERIAGILLKALDLPGGTAL